jgi:hypothetical protein
MLTTEDARPVPAAALAALDADDFHAVVQASISHSTDPAVWDALTDPKIIDRTRTVLAGIHVDVQNQLSLANADLSQAKDAGYALGPEGKAAYFAARAEQGDWRRKATSFRRIVEQRIALVKARTPRPENRPVGSGAAKRRYAEALEALARAVAAHRDTVLSGTGGENDDDDLWDCLDKITVSDGKGGEQALAEWLAFLDDVREDGE